LAGRGVIWDLDGTLVNTSELHYAAWKSVCDSRGREFSRVLFAQTFGRRNPEILAQLFGDRLDVGLVQQLGDYKEECFRAAARAEGVGLLPGVMPLMEELTRQGWRHAIGSSAPRANIELLAEVTGLAPHLAALVAMEDTRRGKPDPEVFLLAAERLGLPPRQCVVVEDAVFGVQAAKAAGMACVAVRAGGHNTAADLENAGADRVVETLRAVRAADFTRLAGA
jgi:beta-phosphoglucomutase family hydrolase